MVCKFYWFVPLKLGETILLHVLFHPDFVFLAEEIGVFEQIIEIQ